MMMMMMVCGNDDDGGGDDRKDDDVFCCLLLGHRRQRCVRQLHRAHPSVEIEIKMRDKNARLNGLEREREKKGESMAACKQSKRCMKVCVCMCKYISNQKSIKFSNRLVTIINQNIVKSI